MSCGVRNITFCFNKVDYDILRENRSFATSNFECSTDTLSLRIPVEEWNAIGPESEVTVVAPMKSNRTPDSLRRIMNMLPFLSSYTNPVINVVTICGFPGIYRSGNSYIYKGQFECYSTIGAHLRRGYAIVEPQRSVNAVGKTLQVHGKIIRYP